MDPEAEFRVLGGYRDLALNLRINTAETREMGVETHVCEVQLLLRCFDTIKVTRHKSLLWGHVYMVCIFAKTWRACKMGKSELNRCDSACFHAEPLCNTTYSRGDF
jgi:hypothetical protein